MPKYITHIRGERIDIESDTELAVNVDGELIFGKHVTMKLLRSAVRFIVPRDMAYFRAPAAAHV